MNEKQPTDWSEQLKGKILELDPDWKIITWEAVAEGTVAAVIVTRIGVDPRVFILGGIKDIPPQLQAELWSVDGFYVQHLPGVTGYSQWGISHVTNASSEEELSSCSELIRYSKRFIERLRDSQWQKLFQGDIMASST